MGRDIDDIAPLSLSDHLPRGDLATEKHILQVGIDDQVVELFVVVEDFADLVVAGVVDQHVNPPEVRYDRGHKTLNGAYIRHVELMVEARPARSLNLRGQRFQFGRGAATNGDACTRLGAF